MQPAAAIWFYIKSSSKIDCEIICIAKILVCKPIGLTLMIRFFNKFLYEILIILTLQVGDRFRVFFLSRLLHSILSIHPYILYVSS